MAVHVSARRIAHTILVVVGAFLIGGVLHRTIVVGDGTPLAPEPLARIALGCGLLVLAYVVRDADDAPLDSDSGRD